MAAWNPITERFEDGTVLHFTDLDAAIDSTLAKAKAAITGTPPIAVNNGAISLSQSGATVNQVLTWNDTAWVPATPATGSGGTTYAPGTGLTLIGNTFAADIGTGADQVAAGNHTHTQYQPTSAKGAANGYAGLDGNAQFAVTGLAPGSGANGQVLQLVGGVWTPTNPAAGTTFTGSNPISVASGVVSVATATNSQLGVVRPDGATITVSGGVITAAGSSGLPIAIGATYDGTTGLTAIDRTLSLVYLNPDSTFTDASPAPFTLANGSANHWIYLVHIGVGVAGITANINSSAGTQIKLYPGDIIPVFYDSIAGTYRASGALQDTGLTIATSLAGADILVVSQSGIDKQAPWSLFTTNAQQNFASWATAGRPTLGTQYAIGFNTTLGRFDFWNGAAWLQHVRVADFSATTSQLFGGSGTNGVASAVAIGSKLSLSAGTLDLNTTTAAAAIYAVPAGERAVAVTSGSSAVVLTAADHLKTVAITGAVGSTVSVDGSTSAGWRAFLANKSTGVGSYSGISGDNGTTALSPGASTTIYRVAGAFYATAAAGSSATSTAYSMGTSQPSGLSGNAVTLTFAPISGTWPTGITLTAAQSGVAGTFSSTTLSPVSGTSTPVTTNFTPSATGTATFSVTNSGSMTNPGNVTYSVVAAATAYTTSLSGTSGSISTPMTMTFTPTTGGWPNSEVITPTVSGVTGTFSPTTVSTTAGLTSAVTCTFTPTATGTAALSSTTSPSMTNTTGSQNYTVSAAAATAYTSTVSTSSGAVGSPVTFTVTPTSGTWPVGEAVTLTNTSLTGTWGSASGGALSGSVLTPTSGGAAASAQFTPSAASTGTINSTTSPSMTNTTGGLTYTALAVATSFGTSPTTVTVASGTATTFTFAPSGGVWGPGETIGLALVTVAGAFSGTTNGSISGSGPYTITPTVGNSTNVTVAFTPSSANGTTGSITVSGTNITATTTSVSVTVQASVPSFPSLPSTGVNSSAISVLARWMTNAGVTGTSPVTTVADQSGNGHDLIATLGPSVGGNVGSNSLPGIVFPTSQAQSANTGLHILGMSSSTGWMHTSVDANHNNTMFWCWKTLGGTFAASGYNYVFEAFRSGSGLNLLHMYYEATSGHFKIYDASLGGSFGTTSYDAGAATNNTLFRVILRQNWPGSGNTVDDAFVNGVKASSIASSTGGGWGNITDLYYGTTNSGWGGGNTGAGSNIEFLEAGIIKGAVPDANCIGTGSLDDYLLSKWG